MKTPEEIKDYLKSELPVHYHRGDIEPRLTPLKMMELEAMHAETLAYIQQLESKLAEYEKPMVPLMLEEAKKLKGVWIEDDGCYWGDIEPTPHPALYFARVNGHLMAFVGDNYMDEEELAYFEESEYNKTWRCWSRKPTDEERKAVKWDE